MTENVIIKTLECCSKANDCIYCEYEPAEYEKGTIGCANELMKSALDLINRHKSKIDSLEYDLELLKQDWIKVEDKLPNENTRVLVYIGVEKLDSHIYTFFDTDRLLNGRWVRWGSYITHWMPLPKPPEMEI